MFKFIKVLFLSLLISFFVAGSVMAVTRVMVPQGGTGVGIFESNTLLVGNGVNAVATTTYTIPIADGSNGQILSTDGAGALSWSAKDSNPSLHIDGGGYVYPQTGDYHSSPYYVATSTAATSTFPYLWANRLQAGEYIETPLIRATSTTATSTMAGGLAIETSGFVYDYSTGNVGIGTNAPAERLSVSNNIIVNSAGTSPLHIGYSGSLTQFSGIWNLADGAPSISNYRFMISGFDTLFNAPTVGGNDGISFSTNNTARMKIYDTRVEFNHLLNNIDVVVFGDTAEIARFDGGTDSLDFNDNKKIKRGTGGDVADWYDGTNWLFQPDVVGTGYMQISTAQPLALVIGKGTAGIDYQLKFDGETNDGILTYMEDEDRLDFDGAFSATAATFDNASSTLLTFTTGWGTTLNSDVTGALTGNADTSTALAANGANCSAGEYALGVDSSGAVEICTDATTEINSVVNGLGGTNLTCAAQSCSVDDSFLLNTGDIATGDYNFDSGTLFIDSSNDKVGIASSTPFEELGIIGQIYVDGSDNATSTIEGNILFQNNAKTNGCYFVFGATTTLECF